MTLLLCLILSANAKELLVHSSRKQHLVAGLFRLYEKEHGVKITVRTGKAAALITALAARRSGRGDVLLTVDAGNLGHAAAIGLLRPVQSTILQELPAHLRDGKNRWFGLSMRARTLVYNPTKVKARELSTYEDLAHPKWRKRLCLRTSKKVYNQSLVAMLIHQHGEAKTLAILKGWVANTVEIFSSDTAVLKAVAAGRCHVGIVNSYYYGRLVKKNPAAPLKIFWPNQDSYGAHVNISGAGVLASSQNPRQAIHLLEWLASPAAQQLFAQVNMEYPVQPGVALPAQVAAWGSFKPNSSFNLGKASLLQKRAVRLMHEANYR